MTCTCEASVTDKSGLVVRVDTCPLCLPVGAITWLIENGRQLDLFSELGPLRGEGRQDILDRSISVSGSIIHYGGLPW